MMMERQQVGQRNGASLNTRKLLEDYLFNGSILYYSYKTKRVLEIVGIE